MLAILDLVTVPETKAAADAREETSYHEVCKEQDHQATKDEQRRFLPGQGHLETR